MAVVISSEESKHFSPSPMRRSSSQPKFVSKNTAGFHTSSSTSRINETYHQPIQVYSDSAPPSFPSSPLASHPDAETAVSYSPKAAATTTLALARQFEEQLQLAPAGEDSFAFPQYDSVEFSDQSEDLDAPPSPTGLGDSYTVSPNENASTNTSRPDSPDAVEHAEDDTAVRSQPSRHVDYLSHDWKEEDIWESWKYIVSRRGDYSNSARLENASWRTWMKSKNKLKTVSPETLNWLKDCDVTWLYGPLQTGDSSLEPPPPSDDSVGLSKSNSFINMKKPILKKRSMSELMLQKSLSSSSLVQQAAAAVQAQQRETGSRLKPQRPRFERATTHDVSYSSGHLTSQLSSLVPSSGSSGVISPSAGKHIHFNEQVEQCIAVEIKGEDDDDVELDRYPYDSSSDEDAIMMKHSGVRKRRPILRRQSSNTSSSDNKTIAMLPSTTLKYREDTPEPSETAMKHSYRSPLLSPSSSQETLRPSKTSGRFFVGDDSEEDEDDDEDDDDTPSFGRTSNKSSSSGGGSGLKRSVSASSLSAEPAGMRRTASGMFMPLEEGEPTGANGGLVGRIVDTVNTARDIAHVIWNVGWRK